VYWLDKVTFKVREDGSIFYITCRLKEEHLDKNLKPSFKSRRTSISV
jgi:hypothetical protein